MIQFFKEWWAMTAALFFLVGAVLAFVFIKPLPYSPTIREQSFSNHTYLIVYPGGIVHAEHCPCKQ